MDSAKDPVQVPAFEATSLESIPATCETVRNTFRSNKTKDLEWRKVQLRKLHWALTDFSQLLFAAFQQDLKKSEFEATLTEVNLVQNDCMFMLEHIDKFAKDEYLGSPHVPLSFSLAGFRTRKEPLGAVLIIGTYNYPLNLSLCPLVGAIAAGCTAVVKPSEGAPAVAMAIRELLEARLDRSAFAVVNGGVPETTALLDQKWDKIFYTGSTQVGTIIARKAAETLTPVTLELGGRNPAFVTKNANIKLAARRLLWAKTLNAGQTCVSQNYVLVERDVVDEFVRELKASFQDFFPRGARDSDLAKVINERQFLRMKKMLDETKGKIVLGGQMDQASLFIEPTAVLVSSVDDSMMADESFGPIFSIYPFSTLSEAIDIANTVDRTPLALYSLGNKAENQRVLDEVNSGGATLNDSFLHCSLNSVAFGGVGTSGTGSYHGKASFDTFTHLRTVAETPAWMESFLRVRYMPYKWSELRKLARMTGSKPDFDRDGNVIKGVAYWTRLVVGLGSPSAKGALGRWCLVLAAYYATVYGLTAERR